MNHRARRFYVAISSLLLLCVLLIHAKAAQKTTERWTPEIPKTWVDDEVAAFELPLAEADASPKHISSDYYYRMPVRPVYKTYPIYAPGKEPPDYLNKLRKIEPEITFDPAKLRTEKDWIKAGELVFDAPVEFVSSGTLFA